MNEDVELDRVFKHRTLYERLMVETAGGIQSMIDLLGWVAVTDTDDRFVVVQCGLTMAEIVVHHRDEIEQLSLAYQRVVLDTIMLAFYKMATSITIEEDVHDG